MSRFLNAPAPSYSYMYFAVTYSYCVVLVLYSYSSLSLVQLEGPQYCSVLALHVLDKVTWLRHRVTFLRRLLVTAHARNVSAQAIKTYVASLQHILPV